MLAALVSCGAASAALGQGVVSGGPVPCVGQRIDTIIVQTLAPTVAGFSRIPIIGNVVRNTHVVTRADVVRAFLLLEPGDECWELRRSESERLLRAQPFIADATIEVLSSRRGGVNLEVTTIDEASLIFSGSVASTSPQVRSVRVGSGNVGGLGLASTFAWRHQPAFDDRFEVRISNYQIAGKPYILRLAGTRDPFGRDYRAEFSQPFRTDIQHFAWRTLVGSGSGYAQFSRRDSGRLALGFRREYAEVGAMARIGAPGRLSLFGLSFTNEHGRTDTSARRITELGFRQDTASAFAGRFGESRAARVNALVGVRGLRFMRVRGFDALRGTQDIPLGLQFGTLIGRGMPALGASSNDLFVASDLYLGFGNQRVAYRLQAQGEGRRAFGAEDWDGMVGSGRLSRTGRVTDRWTQALSVEWSGTLRALVPHALSLELPDGGVRGVRQSAAVGSRRGIARVDEQIYLGAPYSFGDFGVGLFADAGQLWAGDLPYGVNTPVRGAAGVALLLAVPMRSTRMWRLEFAAPINREPGSSSWQVRLSHSDRTPFLWREPADVDGARARAVPSSIYSWP